MGIFIELVEVVVYVLDVCVCVLFGLLFVFDIVVDLFDVVLVCVLCCCCVVMCCGVFIVGVVDEVCGVVCCD